MPGSRSHHKSRPQQSYAPTDTFPTLENASSSVVSAEAKPSVGWGRGGARGRGGKPHGRGLPNTQQDLAPTLDEAHGAPVAKGKKNPSPQAVLHRDNSLKGAWGATNSREEPVKQNSESTVKIPAANDTSASSVVAAAKETPIVSNKDKKKKQHAAHHHRHQHHASKLERMQPLPPGSLIDVGINLTDGMFQGAYRGKNMHPSDFDDIIHRAAAVGVRCMIITGTSLKESRAAVDLAHTLNKSIITHGIRFFCTVGCHPTRAKEFARNPEVYGAGLRSLIQEHRYDKESHPSGVVVAVGECGIDYDREFFTKKEVQLPYFLEQIAIAEETRLPLFLHARNTGSDFLAIMKEHRHRFSRGLVHSFTGPVEELQGLIDLDLHVSVNGCSMKTEENLNVVKAMPLEYLLLETDGPWCEIKPTHASHKYLTTEISGACLKPWKTVRNDRFEKNAMVKSRNEPAHMIQVLDVVHSLRKSDVDGLRCDTTTMTNAKKGVAKTENQVVSHDVQHEDSVVALASTFLGSSSESMEGPLFLADLATKNTNDVFQLW